MGSFNYILMHKDIPITFLSFSETGDILYCAEKKINKEHIPVICSEGNVSIEAWWKERAIPHTRSNLSAMLKAKGYSLPEKYLLNNLGLSLTDCYWVKPLDVDLSWKDVNLFTNPFKDDSLKYGQGKEDSLHYSPNSSLTGSIEKTWSIKDGERFLIKGNHSEKSLQSINEVFATSIHKLQGHPHAEYELLHIEGKEYDYGCITRIFTSENLELVSAYDLLMRTGKTGDYYNILLDECEKCGLDRHKVASEIDYIIMTDYIMSQTDRHFNNIGFLRNPDTLQYYGLAPIYDSGNSMYFDSISPKNEHDLEYLGTKGFSGNLEHSLRYVTDFSAVDLSKLPSVLDLYDLYSKDGKEDKEHIKGVCYAYERRIERCKNLQRGISAEKPLYFSIPKNDISLVNAFYDDSSLRSPIKRLQGHYHHLNIQQEKGLWDLAKQTRLDIDDTLKIIIRLFENKGFTRDDFYRYIQVMDIKGIPDNRDEDGGGDGCKDILKKDQNKSEGDEDPDSDDFIGLGK